MINPRYDADTLVSIIVTAHNVGDYLDACLRSVCQSQHERLEVVVVDDGSTDQTGKIVDSWAGRDERVHSHRLDHVGRRSALEYAHSAASGELLCWVDADDLVHTGALGACIEALDEGHELVYTHRDLIDAHGNVLGPHSKNKIRYRTNQLLVDNMIFHLRMFTNRLFEASGGVGEFEAAIDWDMNLRMTEHTTPREIPRRLYSYRVHETQMSRTPAQLRDGQAAVRNALKRRNVDADLVVNAGGWHIRSRKPKPPLQLP